MNDATTTRTPAEEISAAAKTLRCDHRFPINQPADGPHKRGTCKKCGVHILDALDVPDALAEPLAVLLEAVGGDMAEQGAVEGSASRQVHPASPLGIGLMEPRTDWTAALAAARAINGTV